MPGRFIKENPKMTAMMVYRAEELRGKGKKAAFYQVWEPLSAVSPYLTRAVLIAEDDKFWSHEGFDFEGMEKALEKDIKKKRLKAGGSSSRRTSTSRRHVTRLENSARRYSRGGWSTRFPRGAYWRYT